MSVSVVPPNVMYPGTVAVADGACVACGSSALVPHLRLRHLRLYRCMACKGLTSLPRPTQAALSSFHDTDTYHHHPYFEHRRADLARAEQRSREVVRMLRSISPEFQPAGARHLDVGCDSGVFLDAFARCHGTSPVGIDVAARSVELARARGIECHHTSLAQASGIGTFTLITMIDVIEHVADPVQCLRQARAMLAPNGYCYLETPNTRSLVYTAGSGVVRLTGGRPAWLCERLFPPEHVQYFSPDGLRAAAVESGLRLVAVTRRRLLDADINVSPPVGLVVQSLQALDRLLGRDILHCAVLTA